MKTALSIFIVVATLILVSPKLRAAVAGWPHQTQWIALLVLLAVMGISQALVNRAGNR